MEKPKKSRPEADGATPKKRSPSAAAPVGKTSKRSSAAEPVKKTTERRADAAAAGKKQGGKPARKPDGLSASERERRKKRILRDALITAGVFVLAGAAVFFLVRFSMTVDAVTLYEPVYKYQVTDKIAYRGMSRISFKDGVTTLQNGESTLQLGADPLYYEGKKSILLPADMILVMPDRPLLARAERFSVLSYTENGVELTRGTDSQMIARGFLYDGADRYVFLSEMRLTWLDQELTLSPLSCVTTTSDRQLLVVDHAADTATMYDTGSGSVLAQSESGYEVDLKTDKLTLDDGTEALLFSRPEVLDPLF